LEKRALILDPADNVASVIEKADAGDIVIACLGSETKNVPALEDIPFGFKISLADLEAGQAVVKYGEVIGKASRPIARGALVHVHNVEGNRGRGDLQKRAED
jgi:altronate dehydratase small subunit